MKEKSKRVLILATVLVGLLAGGGLAYLVVTSIPISLDDGPSMSATITAQALLLSLGGFVGINSIKSASELQEKLKQDHLALISSTRTQLHDLGELFSKGGLERAAEEEMIQDLKEQMKFVQEVEQTIPNYVSYIGREKRKFANWLRYNLFIGLIGILVALLGIAFTTDSWLGNLFACEAVVLCIGQLTAFTVLVFSGVAMMGMDVYGEPEKVDS